MSQQTLAKKHCGKSTKVVAEYAESSDCRSNLLLYLDIITGKSLIVMPSLLGPDRVIAWLGCVH